MVDNTLNQSDIVARAARRRKLECEKQKLESIKARLNALSFWRPAKGLAGVVDETIGVIDNLQARLENKAIVAVVGGTGAGKSTLVNALCGVDGTVAEGIERPTTRAITALARSASDAEVLVDNFKEGEITVCQNFAFRFRDVVLVDTPDTDSSECADYSALLERVLQCADALVCVFPAQDPKRRDNLARLAARVAQFQSKHVFLVLNQCDRINESELAEIREDFEANVKKSWTKTGPVFLASARSSLENPHWIDGERPVNNVNEFGKLCEAIEELDGMRFADKRIERAQELAAETVRYVRSAIAECGDWHAMRDRLADFESRLSCRLAEQEADKAVAGADEWSALLYRKIAQRWRGPIGVYLHLGLFAGSVASAFGFLNPLNWPKRFWAKFRKGSGGQDDLRPFAPAIDWQKAKGAVLETWPQLGAKLVKDFQMSPDLLDGEKAISLDALEEAMAQTWPRKLNEAADKIARSRSHPLLQIVVHLPLVAMLAWALCELVPAYFEKHYLPEAYYPHLCAILLILWLAPAWLVQSRFGAVGGKAKELLKKSLLAAEINAPVLSVAKEVDAIISIQSL